MSANRFEYAEVCPTCEQAGAKNPDTDKIFSLGYDIDEGQICCANGHTFEQLPSEVVVPVSNGALLESATNPLQKSATSGEIQGQDSTENEPDSVLRDSVFRASDNHSLEAKNEPEAVSYGQVDSDRLESISKSLDTPEKVAADINERAAKMSPERRAQADRETTRIAAEVELRNPRDGSLVQLVGPGSEFKMPNGDCLFGIVVPERWMQAVIAEAENQGQTPSAYLAEWFERALESEWVSSYTQTVAGSPQ